ncbi:unnamed protein product [Caenorhabditis bovis]|uniref:Serpentine receptor class r-10 n=1 Tax=Caenorhabditis bovis TaxID=2654633 RepID=A0A8S1EDG1_9PELO|nr:unnamed protein product [Caenorhabditis bovis]
MVKTLHAVQYFAFLVSQISNWTLLYLIVKKSSSRIGSYKNLMLAFSIYSIAYSLLEVMVQPIFHNTKSSSTLMIGDLLNVSQTIGSHLISKFFHCGCSSRHKSALQVSRYSLYDPNPGYRSHFVFRYIAICKSNYLHHISGFNLYKIFLPPLILFITWFSVIYISFWPSEIKSAYLYNELMEHYNVDSYQIGHICELYFYYTKEGELVISWMDYFGGIFAILIISICVIVILICGFKTYSKMQSYTEKSKKTKDLNNQLFRALILQTIVPAIMMFAPVGAVISLPMSGVNVGKNANLATLTIGFYPALDAIIVICVIKDYRQTILGGNKARVSTTIPSSNSNM